MMFRLSDGGGGILLIMAQDGPATSEASSNGAGVPGGRCERLTGVEGPGTGPEMIGNEEKNGTEMKQRSEREEWDAEVRKTVEAEGFRIGSVAEFLGLNEEESLLVEANLSRIRDALQPLPALPSPNEAM